MKRGLLFVFLFVMLISVGFVFGADLSACGNNFVGSAHNFGITNPDNHCIGVSTMCMAADENNCEDSFAFCDGNYYSCFGPAGNQCKGYDEVDGENIFRPCEYQRPECGANYLGSKNNPEEAYALCNLQNIEDCENSYFTYTGDDDPISGIMRGFNYRCEVFDPPGPEQSVCQSPTESWDYYMCSEQFPKCGRYNKGVAGNYDEARNLCLGISEIRCPQSFFKFINNNDGTTLPETTEGYYSCLWRGLSCTGGVGSDYPLCNPLPCFLRTDLGTCQECNVEGEVVNKELWTPCETSDSKSGMCCGGGCKERKDGYTGVFDITNDISINDTGGDDKAPYSEDMKIRIELFLDDIEYGSDMKGYCGLPKTITLKIFLSVWDVDVENVNPDVYKQARATVIQMLNDLETKMPYFKDLEEPLYTRLLSTKEIWEARPGGTVLFEETVLIEIKINKDAAEEVTVKNKVEIFKEDKKVKEKKGKLSKKIPKRKDYYEDNPITKNDNIEIPAKDIKDLITTYGGYLNQDINELKEKMEKRVYHSDNRKDEVITDKETDTFVLEHKPLADRNKDPYYVVNKEDVTVTVDGEEKEVKEIIVGESDKVDKIGKDAKVILEEPVGAGKKVVITYKSADSPYFISVFRIRKELFPYLGDLIVNEIIINEKDLSGLNEFLENRNCCPSNDDAENRQPTKIQGNSAVDSDGGFSIYMLRDSRFFTRDGRAYKITSNQKPLLDVTKTIFFEPEEFNEIDDIAIYRYEDSELQDCEFTPVGNTDYAYIEFYGGTASSEDGMFSAYFPRNSFSSTSLISLNTYDVSCPGLPVSDDDRDGIFNDVDNCFYISNPGQEDLDANGVGDVCEADITREFSVDVVYEPLIAYWQFNGNLDDFNGLYNASFVSGEGDYVEEIFEYGLNFEGIDDNNGLGYPIIMEDYPEFSLSAWIKSDNKNIDSTHPVVLRAGNAIMRTHNFEGRMYCQFKNTLGEEVFTSIEENNFNMRDGKWHSVVCTYDGSEVRAYGDGKLLSSAPFTGTIDTSSDIAYYAIGSEHNQNEANVFEGVIDEVEIMKESFSDAEILRMYELQKSWIMIPGDANWDICVNGFDLALLRQGDLRADFTGDGIVNAFDLAILRQNMNKGCGSLFNLKFTFFKDLIEKIKALFR